MFCLHIVLECNYFKARIMVRPPLLKLGTMGPQPVSKDVAPMFLPGELYGQRCLVGYSPQSRKELDMAE